MLLKRIHHAAIFVSDYQVSRTFYVETLELPILRENFREEHGDWKLDVQIGENELEIFSVPNLPECPSVSGELGLRHLAFYVEDVEQAVQELKKKGIVCEPIRMDRFTQRRCTFFKDPDGLLLELHE